MRTSIRSVTGLVFALLAVATAQAFRHPEHEALPNFDKRRPLAGPEVEAKKELGRALGREVRGARVELHPSLGVPRWVGSTAEFLTGPGGVGKSVKAASAARFNSNDPHRPVKAFVQEHAAMFGHGAEALERARVERDWTTAHSGMRSVIWQQEIDGVPVYGAKFGGHFTQQGELVAVMSEFVPDLDRVAGRVANRRALVAAPGLDQRAAIVAAGRNIGAVVTPAALAARGAAEGVTRRQKFSGGGLVGESDARLTWFALDHETLRLAWQTFVTRPQGGEMFEVVIDAQTGAALLRRCLTEYLTNATYNVHTSDSPSPLSPGHATPITNQPPIVPRTLVTTPAWNTNASPNGWINDGATETLGNNVDAHLDRNNDNQPDLPRPQGTAFRVFDYAVDFAQAPTTATNQAHAVVQLFYLNNWIHDRLWELGFTEAAGNFQSNNFSRGGAGNDAVQADAQDGGGFNNANFATPPDGSPGRMQMYLFDGPTPDRDGDLDAEIVVHEYGHGLSNRRVGTGAGISALQSRGMGEGWSDWYALAMLAEPGDALDGNFATGGYATFQLFGLTQNYYYGIRRYPYSTNLTKNPLTFRDIDPTQYSTHPGIPINPIFGFGSPTEVHNQGEVWCIALWEMRHNFVVKHGFTNGNELALRLVTDGMALAPNNPNFLEARDGIIMADLVLNAGANKDEIWAGFAKRGMGFSATSPVSSTTTGLVEAFDLPDDLRILPTVGGVFSGPVGGPFTPTNRSFTMDNTGPTNLTWTAAVSSNWLSLSTNSGTLLSGGPSTNLTVSANSNAAALPRGVYSTVLSITNLLSGRVQSRAFQIAVDPASYFTENFEALDNDLDFTQFEFFPNGSSSYYGICRRNVASFPTPTTGATPVPLGDDAFAQVILGSGAMFPYYGTNRNSFFIGSNGYITFGSGDNEYSESLANHFDLARISALFLDLDPGLGGTISRQQFANRVVVTWENIREYGTALQNSMQVEMFFDGRITVTYLNISSQHGLAGFSVGGGVPVPFTETDLSATPGCPPPLVMVLPATTIEGAGVLTNQGRISFVGGVWTNDVTFTLTSSDSNEVVVPSSVVIPAGQTNGLFNLTVVDDGVVDGPRSAQITATAAGFNGAATNILVGDNEPVTITLNLPASANENDGVLVNQGSVSVNLPPANNVVVSLVSSNVSKVVLPPSVTLLTGQTSAVFSVTIVDNALSDGPALVGASATVFNWASGFDQIQVFDDESLASGVSHFVLSDVGVLQSVGAPFALDITARGATNEVVTDFAADVALRGLRAAATNEPIGMVAFTGYADLGEGYPNTLAAISATFTNYVVTNTVATNAAQLATLLVGRQVMLIPAQPLSPPGMLDALGTQWGTVLREFTARGGVVIACSGGAEEHLILANAGLMSVVFDSGGGYEPLSNSAAGHPITAGVPALFDADSLALARYTSTNATPLIRSMDGLMVAGVRNYGLGHAVLIGANYNFLGTPMNLVIANSVAWAQQSRYLDVPVLPASTGAFTNGLWAGAVTVLQEATNMFLLATDAIGHYGIGNPFTAVSNNLPLASNLSFSILANTSSNLPLSGSHPNSNTLSYLISVPPTNGLLTGPGGTNNVFAYTPMHAFTGADAFNFRVTDGSLTSPPALVSITVVAPVDTDGDGMTDAWETARGLNPGINDAAADPDGDGLTNLQEYRTDSDPLNSASGVPALTVTAMTNGTYRLTWNGVGGVRYRVRYSDGHTNTGYAGIFTDVVRTAAAEICPAGLGSSTNMFFVDDFSLTGGAPANGRRFYLLKILP